MLADGSLHTSHVRVVIRMIRHSDKMIRIQRSAHHPMIQYPGVIYVLTLNLPPTHFLSSHWFNQSLYKPLIGSKWQRILSQCHGHVTSTQKFTIIMNIIIIISTIKSHIWEMSSKWNISLAW